MFITSLIGNFTDDTIMYIWKYYIFLYHELLHGYNLNQLELTLKMTQKNMHNIYVNSSQTKQT